MTNPYELQLRRELDDLRTRRVNLRRILASPKQYGDALDNLRRIEHVARELKATDRDWQRLHYELRIDLPGPAVRLDVAAVSAAKRGAVRFETSARRAAPYVTRMIGGPGCR